MYGSSSYVNLRGLVYIEKGEQHHNSNVKTSTMTSEGDYSRLFDFSKSMFFTSFSRPDY